MPKKKKPEALLYKPHYGKPVKMNLQVLSYDNNASLYVGLVRYWGGEEYCDITVNVSGSGLLPPYCACVKNYAENEGIERFIVENGLAKPTGQTIRSGFVTIPVYQFDKERLAALSVNGVVVYEERLGTKKGVL